MNVNVKNYYFSLIRMFCMIVLLIYYVISSEKSLRQISVEWFLLAIMLAVMVGYGLVISKKVFFIFAEILITIIMIAIFKDKVYGLIVLPMVILDVITFFELNFILSIFAFTGVFINIDTIFLYCTYCIFIIIIYYQKYVIVEQYKKYIENYEKEEYDLKDSITFRDNKFKKDLENNSLFFENKILEEKSRLSQALHDKLGHSINGSIYQLEACKILINTNPEDSRKMVQAVIDNLRTSMDEIRKILRREKPDKGKMANLQLIGLCEECEKNYGIKTEVKYLGEDKDIPETLWEVILDNSFEAISNALKYSKCSSIIIEITILHKVIRCSIRDNGIGCSVIKEGMGLQGMKDRTRKVNGYFNIDSEEGFCINMILPFQEER